MIRTVHLGFTCSICRSRVPVYSFPRSNGNGSKPCTPPLDRRVECPTCHTIRHVPFAEIMNLDRWEEIANSAAA